MTVVTQLRLLLPDVDVLVVDDGSNDSTFTAASSTGVRVIRHARNLGYGAALKSGIRAAQTPLWRCSTPTASIGPKTSPRCFNWHLVAMR